MTDSSSGASPLSPAERRQRNREETIASILAAARAVIQEQGGAALNLNEVARRVRMRPQSLASYFPNKAAVQDALIDQALIVIREGDEAAYRDHPAGWNQVEAWFINRMSLAEEHPDLYHLVFDAPVPGYVPADHIVELTRGMLARSREMVAGATAAGVMNPGMPVEQATDMLLAFRRGLTAERIGKRRFIPPGSNRFDELLPALMRMLKTAWAPAGSAAPSTNVQERGDDA